MALAYLPCVCQLVQALKCLFPTITLKWSITLVILILYRYRLLIAYHNILKSVKHNDNYSHLPYNKKEYITLYHGLLLTEIPCPRYISF